MAKPLTGKYLNCQGCGKECYMPINRLKTFKYCSRDCKNKFGCTQRIKAVCAICTKDFEHISARCNKAKYCSRTCFYKSLKGKGSVKHICKHCGNEFFDSPSRKRIYCSLTCIKKEDKKTFKPNYITVRKAMKARNMIQKCEMCGYDKFPDILGIHHIDENKKNNSIENLMILCPLCHSLIHHKHICH